MTRKRYRWQDQKTSQFGDYTRASAVTVHHPDGTITTQAPFATAGDVDAATGRPRTSRAQRANGIKRPPRRTKAPRAVTSTPTTSGRSSPPGTTWMRATHAGRCSVCGRVVWAGETILVNPVLHTNDCRACAST